MARFIRTYLLVWNTILFITIASVACMQSYTGKYFSYPPGSKPHESESWIYLGEVVTTKNKSGSEYQLSKRNVRIYVYDKQENRILDDKMEFTSGRIIAEIDWNQFELLRINLFEKGDDSMESDKYSKELLKEPGGRRSIASLIYIYNKDKNEFIRQPH